MYEWMIARAEKDTGENSDWLRDVVAVSKAAFWKFGLFVPMSRHRKSAPVDLWHIVRIAAIAHEDCGPCLQTIVTFARRDDVPADTVQACLDGELDRLTADQKTAWLFGKAVCENDIELETHRTRLLEKYGQAVMVDLSFAIAGARVFPTLKRGLGHGLACSQVTVHV